MGLQKICAENNGSSYKFKQDTTTLYSDLCGGGGSSRVGMCIGLSVVWLHQAVKCKNARAINDSWVDGDGRMDVSSMVNNILDKKETGSWTDKCNKQMKLKGFTASGNYNISRDQLKWYFGNLTSMNAIIVIYGNGAMSHAVSVNKMGDNVKFFDANFGYFEFPKTADFLTWLDEWAKKTEPQFGTWYTVNFYNA